MSDTSDIEIAPSGIWAKWGGRRFVMCMGAGMVFTGLLLHGDIDQNVFQFLIVATIGAYITGNTTQKVLNK